MAAPNPERELSRLEQELARGLPRCLVLLGPGAWFRARACDLVLAKVPAQSELRQVDGEQAGDGEELALLRGGGLFARQSCLLVRRAEAWLTAHKDTLAGTIARIVPTATLVLETTRLDRRTRLGKAIEQGGGVFEFRELYADPFDARQSPLETELVQWLVGRSRAAQVPLRPEAAFLLIATVGKEPGELVQELQRLKAQCGAVTAPLRPEDLRGRLNTSFESNPFELAEAVLAGDRRRALRSLAAMFRRGVRDRDGGTMDKGGVFPFATSWMYQALTQAYEGRLLLDRGVPLGEIGNRVGVRMFQDRFLRQVQKNPAPRLARMLGLLARAQTELRTTGEEPELLLEAFVARALAGAGT